MTQLEHARNGTITPEMEAAAAIEKKDAAYIRDSIAAGVTVITKNIRHKVARVCAVGKGLKTKVNANLGASDDTPDMAAEKAKLTAAIDSGADTIMDLSVGKCLKEMLDMTIKESTVPVGTVPLYEIATNVLAKGKISDMTWDDIEPVLVSQAKAGVDFFTIHAGVTKDIVEYLKKRERILDVVSRGGSFMIDWIAKNNRENPLYDNYDKILEIAKEYDVTISLGDGMRPGAIKDAGDEAQIQELIVLGSLAKRAREAGVQVMIEGPGHVHMDQIAYNVNLEKSLCGGAPFYVLGPLVTDAAPGYDHITAAIGGAIAAAAGADFLCYVTPSEHLRLPTVDDIKDGVIASRIAAHAADLAKGVASSSDLDDKISRARKIRDWDAQFALALDPVKPRKYRDDSKPKSGDVCSMCNDFCPIKRGEECLK